MNITVNGNENKLNIGCRTFISIAELLKLLNMNQDFPLTVSLNGETIHQQDLPKTAVSNTDSVTLLGVTNAGR